MQRLPLGPICAGCLVRSSLQKPLGNPSQSWLAKRLLSRKPARPRPSRMVLSNRVARPTDPNKDTKRTRRTIDGPFSGMNQTVARIPPKAQARQGSRPGGPDARLPRRSEKMDKRDPRKALKMQRALATISYGKRMNIKTRMQEIESFDNFDLLPSVKEAVHADALKGMVDIKPTPVQRLAIPALLGQGNKSRAPAKEFLLAAETGSGKTLAYLLPAINAMKIAEAQDPDIQAYRKRFEEERERQKEDKKGSKKHGGLDEPHPTMARPKVVVLVPTAELVDQVGAVARSLSHIIKFRSEKLSANYNPTTIHRNLYSPRGVDVVIATPHLLSSISDSDPNVLAQVTHLVVDEADSLLDRSFTPVTTSVIDRAMPSLKQLVICSATIPKRLDHYLASSYPDMVRITTPNLHAIPRRVQLGVIDVSKEPYRNNKNLACADAIYTIGKEAALHEGPAKGEIEVRRIMVFVNEREKTQEVADYLVSKGIDAVALNRDTSEQRHSEMLSSFTTSEPLRVPAPSQPRRGVRSLANAKVIVATDLASRGIDTLAVRHVVLYDVPLTTIDFIHRLGRAGRMGRRGRGIVLVGNQDRKDVVAEVKESMFMGQALI